MSEAAHKSIDQQQERIKKIESGPAESGMQAEAFIGKVDQFQDQMEQLQAPRGVKEGYLANVADFLRQVDGQNMEALAQQLNGKLDQFLGKLEQAAGKTEHTIQKGEYISALAPRFLNKNGQPLSWQKLYKHNKSQLRSENPDLIYPGEKLQAPPGYAFYDKSILPEASLLKIAPIPAPPKAPSVPNPTSAPTASKPNKGENSADMVTGAGGEKKTKELSKNVSADQYVDMSYRHLSPALQENIKGLQTAFGMSGSPEDLWDKLEDEMDDLGSRDTLELSEILDVFGKKEEKELTPPQHEQIAKLMETVGSVANAKIEEFTAERAEKIDTDTYSMQFYNWAFGKLGLGKVSEVKNPIASFYLGASRGLEKAVTGMLGLVGIDTDPKSEGMFKVPDVLPLVNMVPRLFGINFTPGEPWTEKPLLSRIHELGPMIGDMGTRMSAVYEREGLGAAIFDVGTFAGELFPPAAVMSKLTNVAKLAKTTRIERSAKKLLKADKYTDKDGMVWTRTKNKDADGNTLWESETGRSGGGEMMTADQMEAMAKKEASLSPKNYKAGDTIEYTTLKGETKKYEVLGESGNGGLILRPLDGKGPTQFPIGTPGMERVKFIKSKFVGKEWMGKFGKGAENTLEKMKEMKDLHGPKLTQAAAGVTSGIKNLGRNIGKLTPDKLKQLDFAAINGFLGKAKSLAAKVPDMAIRANLMEAIEKTGDVVRAGKEKAVDFAKRKQEGVKEWRQNRAEVKKGKLEAKQKMDEWGDGFKAEEKQIKEGVKNATDASDLSAVDSLIIKLEKSLDDIPDPKSRKKHERMVEDLKKEQIRKRGKVEASLPKEISQGRLEPNVPSFVKIPSSLEMGKGNKYKLLSANGGIRFQGGGRSLDLKEGKSYIVGRGNDVDIKIDSPNLSQAHLKITVKNGRAIVEDLGSSNGTTISKPKVKSERKPAKKERVETPAQIRQKFEAIKKDPSQPQLTKDLLKDKRFMPQGAVEIGGQKFYMSRVIQTKVLDRTGKYVDGYPQVLMFVKDEETGKFMSRILYKSNSDGGWRVCPGKRTDGGYSKGEGAAVDHYTQTTKPHEDIIKYLDENQNNIVEYRGDLIREKFDARITKKAFNDKIRRFDDRVDDRGALDDFREYEAGKAFGVRAGDVFYKGKGKVEYKIKKVFKGNETKNHPNPDYRGQKIFVIEGKKGLKEVPESKAGEYFKDTKFPRMQEVQSDFRKLDSVFNDLDGFVPDFSKGPIKEPIELDHTLLGKITVETYRGKLNGRSIEWNIAYDKDKRVWIDSIRPADGKVNSYGLPEEIIDSGLLTNKPLEYHTQAAALREGSQKAFFNERYADITPMLSNLLPIREFKRELARREAAVQARVVSRAEQATGTYGGAHFSRPGGPGGPSRPHRRPASSINPDELSKNLNIPDNKLGYQLRQERAANLLGRKLSSKQKEAILRAHDIKPSGRSYTTAELDAKDGLLRKSGLDESSRKYTKEELDLKRDILRDAGFTGREGIRLLRNGICGKPAHATREIKGIPVRGLRAHSPAAHERQRRIDERIRLKKEVKRRQEKERRDSIYNAEVQKRGRTPGEIARREAEYAKEIAKFKPEVKKAFERIIHGNRKIGEVLEADRLEGLKRMQESEKIWTEFQAKLARYAKALNKTPAMKEHLYGVVNNECLKSLHLAKTYQDQMKDIVTVLQKLPPGSELAGKMTRALNIKVKQLSQESDTFQRSFREYLHLHESGIMSKDYLRAAEKSYVGIRSDFVGALHDAQVANRYLTSPARNMLRNIQESMGITRDEIKHFNS